MTPLSAKLEVCQSSVPSGVRATAELMAESGPVRGPHAGYGGPPPAPHAPFDFAPFDFAQGRQGEAGRAGQAGRDRARQGPRGRTSRETIQHIVGSLNVHFRVSPATLDP